MVKVNRMSLRTDEGFSAFLMRNSGNIAFLRFEVEGLKQDPLSDWDIAIRDRERGLSDCADLFGDAWLRIPREYVVQHYYQWGQVDLLPSFQWNGFEYLDQELFWAGVSEGPDGIPRPALGHDAYITWMTGLLWGQSFKPRYADFVKAGAVKDEGIFRQSLMAVFGEELAEELFNLAVIGRAGEAVTLVPKMRKKLRWSRLQKEPFEAFETLTRHWLCELTFHFKTPFPWIGILGPDGSGKSTVIEGLASALEQSRIGMKSIHWLPQLRDDTETSSVVVTDPHSRPPKSACLSFLQLGKIFVVWWIALFKNLLHLRAKKSLVLSDRFYPDLLADPRRYRYGASTKFAAFVFRFLPKPDRVIVLHTRAETILKRKQEVTPEELERQLGSYQKIADDWGERAVLVDCGQKPEAVVEEVLVAVVKALAKRTR